MRCRTNWPCRIYRLEEWRNRALAGIDAGLKEREGNPLARQLDETNRRIDERVMEVEMLRKEREVRRHLAVVEMSQTTLFPAK